MGKFVNSDSIAKVIVREVICEECKFSVGKGAVVTLSLPADNMLWEMELLYRHPDTDFHMFLIEQDEEVCEKLCKKVGEVRQNFSNFNATVFNMTIRNFIDSSKEVNMPKFDIIYLDYCGKFIDDRRQEILDFKASLKSNSTLITTFLGQRDSCNRTYKRLIKELPQYKRDVKVIRKYVIPRVIQKDTGLDTSLVISYKDSWTYPNSSSMMTYIHQRGGDHRKLSINLSRTIK